jgi:hypothetical protein
MKRGEMKRVQRGGGVQYEELAITKLLAYLLLERFSLEYQKMRQGMTVDVETQPRFFLLFEEENNKKCLPILQDTLNTPVKYSWL